MEFRGKSTEKDEWVYGNLIQKEGYSAIIIFDYDSVWNEYVEVEVDPKTVGLFTGGIPRSHQKKIYSGDLHLSEAEVDGEPHKSYLPVVFDNGAFWIDESFKKDGTCLSLLCKYDEDINIVGNIHENPELLK